jgi:hypothetical protein
MTNALIERIEALRHDIETAEGGARREALDHLEQAVLQLETRGVQAPGWARASIAAKLDEAAEDQFDNMPI